MTLTVEQVSDRLDRLPVSTFHVKILVIAALSLLFDTLDHVVTGFVLTSLRTTWSFDVETIGLISAIGLAGYLLGSLFCGFVADRIGRKKTILFTLILYSLFSAARGLSGNLASLAVLNFFTFAFIGAESSTVPPYLAELWPARVRGKLVGWMMGFFGVGIALAPIWALLIIPNLGWRWAFLLTAPFALIGGMMRSNLPESPRWLVKSGRFAEAEAVVDLHTPLLVGATLVTAPLIKISARRFSACLRTRPAPASARGVTATETSAPIFAPPCAIRFTTSELYVLDTIGFGLACPAFCSQWLGGSRGADDTTTALHFLPRLDRLH
jgi:MFS family permease